MERIGIDELAARLLHQGYIDNEPDARLSAIRIILAMEAAVRSVETTVERTPGVDTATNRSEAAG